MEMSKRQAKIKRGLNRDADLKGHVVAEQNPGKFICNNSHSTEV